MCKPALYGVYVNKCEVSLRIIVISISIYLSAVTLKVLLCFLLMDEPSSEAAHDIYPSSVNNLGGQTVGGVSPGGYLVII